MDQWMVNCRKMSLQFLYSRVKLKLAITLVNSVTILAFCSNEEEVFTIPMDKPKMRMKLNKQTCLQEVAFTSTE